jgi:hypothetical protein
MKTKPIREPVPALTVALALAILSHRANVNAARALGVPVAAIALLLAGALAVGGVRST